MRELKIEKQLIHILSEHENQWRYRKDIKTEADLWVNFRSHLNRLNVSVLDGNQITDQEFEQISLSFKQLTSTPF